MSVVFVPFVAFLKDGFLQKKSFLFVVANDEDAVHKVGVKETETRYGCIYSSELRAFATRLGVGWGGENVVGKFSRSMLRNKDAARRC